jgi:hypothetical protein
MSNAILTSEKRIGNFTSSEIVALTAMDRSGKQFGQKALTYIREKRMERRLGRSIKTETTAKALSWGTLCEKAVAKLLPEDYIFTSDQTDIHPAFPFWAGSGDAVKLDEGRTVGEVKCPITLKSFCDLVDPIYDGLTGMDAMNKIRDIHEDGEKYYIQTVSNSILKKTKYGELIVYMPYKSELQFIQMIANNLDGEELSQYYWIINAREDELPYLNEGGFYNNLNIIRFEIPREDINFLIERVVEAGKLLLA